MTLVYQSTRQWHTVTRSFSSFGRLATDGALFTQSPLSSSRADLIPSKMPLSRSGQASFCQPFWRLTAEELTIRYCVMTAKQVWYSSYCPLVKPMGNNLNPSMVQPLPLKMVLVDLAYFTQQQLKSTVWKIKILVISIATSGDTGKVACRFLLMFQEQRSLLIQDGVKAVAANDDSDWRQYPCHRDRWKFWRCPTNVVRWSSMMALREN